jgi:hypothetical protein
LGQNVDGAEQVDRGVSIGHLPQRRATGGGRSGGGCGVTGVTGVVLRQRRLRGKQRKRRSGQREQIAKLHRFSPKYKMRMEIR